MITFQELSNGSSLLSTIIYVPAWMLIIRVAATIQASQSAPVAELPLRSTCGRASIVAALVVLAFGLLRAGD
jgi:hypothetical protein